jgi:hypothetical protein
MAFIGQGEWRDRFGQLLGEHLDPTLEAFGLTTDTLITLLGKDRVAILWGCVVEDLMTRNAGADLRNVVDDYLGHAGRDERDVNRAYMFAVRRSVMSLYEVIEMVPGKGLVIHDAIRDLGPVRVHQETRTRTLAAGDWIAARCIPDGEGYSITGSLLGLTSEASNRLLDQMRSVATQLGLGTLDSMEDHQLRLCTPIFTQAWLLDTIPASFDHPSATGLN